MDSISQWRGTYYSLAIVPYILNCLVLMIQHKKNPTYTPKIKIKQNKNQKRSFKERSSTEIVFLLILSTEADFAYNDLIGFQWWYSKSYFGIA